MPFSTAPLQGAVFYFRREQYFPIPEARAGLSAAENWSHESPGQGFVHSPVIQATVNEPPLCHIFSTQALAWQVGPPFAHSLLWLVSTAGQRLIESGVNPLGICPGSLPLPEGAHDHPTNQNQYIMKKTALILAALVAGASLPAQTPAPATPAAPVALAAAPASSFSIYGWVEAGATLNSKQPDDRQNFGRLFDDRANELLLNQVVLTAEKTLAPKARPCKELLHQREQSSVSLQARRLNI